MLKTFCRALKADSLEWRLILLPIWGTIWLIDKAFGLKIYISEFEEASKPKSIVFKKYDKYILTDTNDLNFIKKAVKDFNLKLSAIKVCIKGENAIIKFEKDFAFQKFHELIIHMEDLTPNNMTYNIKGILINRIKRSESYFVFDDPDYPLKLVGKTYKNKKIYVDLGFNTDKEIIFYNSNIDYFKNFAFDSFEADLVRMKFEDIEKDPAHNKSYDPTRVTWFLQAASIWKTRQI